MKITQLVAVAGVVTAVGVTGMTGASIVNAQSGAHNDSLIDKMATKFNVDKSEVQAVFDEDKAARQAEHQAELSNRLQKAVDEGKITPEQKTSVEAKLKELQEVHQTRHDELKTWADQNGIDMNYLMGAHHGNSTRLQDAVDNGDISAEQKTLIEQKYQELQIEREAAKEEIMQWALDNGIDERYIMKGGHGGHRGGPGNRS